MIEYHLPFIVNGRVIEGNDLHLKYRDGEVSIFMPEVSRKVIRKINEIPSRILYEVPSEDIISFLNQVGDLWKNKNYELRKESVKISSLTTGYHEKMIQFSYDMIPYILSKEFLNQTIDIELHNRKFLDEWIEAGETMVRAIPIGKLLHIVAGNVPIVSILSFMMGILTKNVNIVKVASGDPSTFIHFVLSFQEIDKNHPVTKTTSALYWKHDSEAEKECFDIVNGILVWGGFDAVHSARKKSKPNQVILEFGPRKSVQLIGKEVYENDTKLQEVAQKIAHDLSLYDQQACHSPQIAFVEGEAEKLCRAIAKAMETKERNLPKGYTSVDEKTAVSHERMMAKFRGDKVFQPDSTKWTIILTKDFENTVQHPLSRTLYVIEVKDLKEVLEYIDETVMVVAFSSFKRLNELKDEIFKRGVDRITVIGKMGYFPLGYPQEGRRNLSQLVKWVGIDVN